MRKYRIEAHQAGHGIIRQIIGTDERGATKIASAGVHKWPADATQDEINEADRRSQEWATEALIGVLVKSATPSRTAPWRWAADVAVRVQRCLSYTPGQPAWPNERAAVDVTGRKHVAIDTTCGYDLCFDGRSFWLARQSARQSA